MAASIPVLRMLIRRDGRAKPAQFIVLGENGLKSSQLPARHTGVAGGTQISKHGGDDADSWSKVSHLEQARLRNRDEEWAD